MLEELLNILLDCIANDDMARFYKHRLWREKRKEIIIRDHYECQLCRKKGILKRLEIETTDKDKKAFVHHIKHLRDYPELGMDNDNLITLCHYCHEEQHPNERHRFQKGEVKFMNEERW